MQNSKLFKTFHFSLFTFHYPRGQSLFEVVLAIGVIGVVIAGIVALASTSLRNTTFSRNNSLATRYTQETVEWLRGQRDASWVTFHTNVTLSSIYCLNTLTWGNLGPCDSSETISDTILFRQVAFSAVVPTSLRADVWVSWTDSQGVHQVTTSTIFTDWRSR